MISVEPLKRNMVAEFFKHGLVRKELADRLLVIPPGRQKLIRNGSPLAMGGVTVPWTGVGICWLNVFPGAKGSALRLMRILFDELCAAQEEFKLHRIHAEVRAEDYTAVKFARLLGFGREFTMEKYGPDKSDYHMMTWQL